MRLFIAIELPKSVKREAGRMLSELKNRASDGRFVPIENMHITLSFLGETDNLRGAVSAMQKAVEGIRSFSLSLGKYDSFRMEGGAGTSHITVKGNSDELDALYFALTAALRDEGFKTQGKRFTPHITLGRSVTHDEKTREELINIQPPLNASMSVQSIVLFESTRRGGEMVYTPIHRERLIQ